MNQENIIKLNNLITKFSINQELDKSDYIDLIVTEDRNDRAKINFELAKVLSESNNKDNLELSKVLIERAWLNSNFSEDYLPLFIKINFLNNDLRNIANAFKRLGMMYSMQNNIDKAVFYFNQWEYAYGTFLKEETYYYDFDILDAMMNLAKPYQKSKSVIDKSISKRKIKLAVLVKGILESGSVLIKILKDFAFYFDKNKFDILFVIPEKTGEVNNSEVASKNIEYFINNNCKVITSGDNPNMVERLVETNNKIEEFLPDILLTTSVIADFSHYFLYCLNTVPVTIALSQGPPSQFTPLNADWSIAWNKHIAFESVLNCTHMRCQGIMPHNGNKISKEEINVPADCLIISSAGRHVKFQSKQWWASIANILSRNNNVYFFALGLQKEQIAFFNEIIPAAIRNRIVFFPWRVDYIRVLAMADINIDTYPTSGGATIVDTMALGIPVVSFSHNYFELYDAKVASFADEIISDNDLIIERDNFEMFEKVVQKLIDNAEFRKLKGQQCKEKVFDNYSKPEDTVRKCEELFVKIIQQKLGSEFIPYQEKTGKENEIASTSEEINLRNEVQFSVIVPTYNQANYLREALDTLLAQTYINWEAVIVNDGSSDDTPKVMEEYRIKDSRFKCFHKENGGVSTALNEGIRNAQGDWICWLSSDDKFEPIALETFDFNIKNYPEEVFFHSDFNEYFEDSNYLKPVGEERKKIVPQPFLQSVALLEYNMIHGISICIHKKVFDKVGYFREDFRNAQDFDMWLRCSMQYRLIHIPVITCTTRYHSRMDTFSAPRFGLYDGAVSCIEHLNKYKFEEFLKFTDSNNLNELVAIIQKIVVIIFNPESLLHQGVGHHYLFVERVAEWINEKLPDNLKNDLNTQFKVIYEQSVKQNFNNQYKSKLRFLIDNFGKKPIVNLLDPIKLLIKNKEYHTSIGDFKESDSIEKYLQRYYKITNKDSIATINNLVESKINKKDPDKVVSVFSDIYNQNAWLSDESVSGPGSTIEQTKTIREQIPKLLKNFNIKSLLDLPCGDFNWMKNLKLDDIDYIGADIIDDLVSGNNSQFSKKNIRFMNLNLIQDNLPTCDMIMVRDCLVHFTFNQAIEAIRNIKKSKIKYLLTTSFVGRTKNLDMATGGWRPLNLQIHPFNFPEPLAVINENCTENDGIYNDKSLCLYDIDKLPSFTKILFVVHNFPPYWYAGTENYTYSLAKELIHSGNDVSVIYPRIDNTLQRPGIYQKEYNGINVYEITYGQNQVHNIDALNSNILSEFNKLLIKNNFDLVHFHHTYGLPVEMLSIPINLKIKTALTLHDFHLICKRHHLFIPNSNKVCSGPETAMKCVDCLVNGRGTPEEKSNWEKNLNANFNYIKALFPRFDLITAPSKYVKDIYEKYGCINENFKVKPLGLNPINYNV